MALELLTPKTDPQQVLQQDLRGQTQTTVETQRIIAPGNLLREQNTTNSSLNLNNGTYPKFTQTAAGTTIQGIAGSKLNGADLSQRNTRISHVYFIAEVLLRADAQCTFDNCRFSKPVTTENGAAAVFNNCTFDDTANVDNTAGVIADVGIVGCARGTLAHVNCTVIMEVS